MKIKESKSNSCSVSGRPIRKSGHSQRRIVIENIYESRTEPNDGVAVQMTLLFFTARPLWVRASKIAIANFHGLAHGGSRPRRAFHDREVISNSETWFLKVVYTLFIRSHSLDTCLGYLHKNLTPSIAFEVIKRLNNPSLGLKFFEFTRMNLSINHKFRTYNFLMRSLCQMGLHDSAKLVFDCMRSDGHSPDDSIIEFLVVSYAQIDKLDIAVKMLEEVHCDAVKVAVVVYNSLLSVLVRRNQVDEAVSLFRKFVASHFRPDNWTCNTLVKGLCGVGEVDKAFEFFNDMGSFGCSPDVVTYNTLINGLCRTNEVDKGCRLLKEVQLRRELSPNVITFTSVISGYCKLGRMDEASILFDEMCSSGVKPNDVTFNALIDGFGKAGELASALAMYEKMLSHGYQPDVVTFTSLINGYCRAGQLSHGLNLWHEMNAKKIFPNGYTFNVLIHALCKDNRLDEARDFLRQLKWSNIVPKPFMYNPVIDGFCKAGNVDEANIIVAEMEEKGCRPDKCTFTILILGNCMKGRMFEAIDLFKKMLAVGCAPDYITVSCLISCLLKAGMPNEAYHIKKTASEDLNLGSSSLRTVHSRANAEIPVAV
ncbi:pentatricopeptide repeat-containing protein At2g06000 [Ziziphus jujuba]|uniref:Pentatricopeptide repeat-containing protein At2g06000 n=1 Tax=Ziziphus jujuba TaxID=326968 RepID=A0A6P4AK26_ZIZJJ|nr:pentatricopeptide repeat-containing protein At2g06000 [Ziziphus jujuba]